MSVISVSFSTKHEFSKTTLPSINLLQGLGVEGDCHSGPEVQHRSRIRLIPRPANLRQVHLIHSELFEEVGGIQADGSLSSVKPGQLGENITTHGIDLLGLSTGTRLHFLNPGISDLSEEHAVVKVTGLRNPCPQIEHFQKGLQKKCLVKDTEGKITGRKAGIMSIVESGGEVKQGVSIVVEEPDTFVAMECV